MSEFTKQEYQRFYDDAVSELSELELWYSRVDDAPYSVRRFVDITVRNLIEDIQRYDDRR